MVRSQDCKIRESFTKKVGKDKRLTYNQSFLRKIREGDNAFNPKDYLGKSEEQYFQILQRWKIDFEKTYLERYPFLTRAPIRHKKIWMKAPRPNIR